MDMDKTIYIRRQDIMREYGLSRYTFDRLEGLKRHILPGRKYAMYLRSEVEDLLIKREVKNENDVMET